jgi:hypothetical protein
MSRVGADAIEKILLGLQGKIVDGTRSLELAEEVSTLIDAVENISVTIDFDDEPSNFQAYVENEMSGSGHG